MKAMLELILEKGFAALTVAEIADRANVGRSTFYAHYAEKEDLLQGSLDGLREFLQEHMDTVGGDPQPGIHPALAFCLPMAEHLGENRRLHAIFAGGRGSALVQEMIHEMWVDFIREGWPEGDALAIEAIAGGFDFAMSWWLAKAPQLEPIEVVRRFRSLVEPGMRELHSKLSRNT